MRDTSITKEPTVIESATSGELGKKETFLKIRKVTSENMTWFCTLWNKYS